MKTIDSYRQLFLTYYFFIFTGELEVTYKTKSVKSFLLKQSCVNINGFERKTSVKSLSVYVKVHLPPCGAMQYNITIQIIWGRGRMKSDFLRPDRVSEIVFFSERFPPFLKLGLFSS